MSDWIVPCNLNEYNVFNAFKDLNAIDWNESAHYSIDDNVYIYISGDVGAIRYKCRVTAIGLTTPDIDDSKYGVVDHREGSTYARFKLVKRCSGDVYSLEKLRENGLTGNLQGPQQLTGALFSYITSFDNIEQKHYKVKEAIWISAALKAYSVYNANKSEGPKGYSFKAKEIRKTASLFCDGTIDDARINQHLNGSHIDSYENYICAAPDDKFRLSYFGEFNEYREFPETLNDEDNLLYSGSTITIADLKKFVKEVYTPIASKIQPGFSKYLKRIIDERPYNIPQFTYTARNAYFNLNNTFCSYLKSLPFIYPHPKYYQVDMARGTSTLPNINWTGIRTTKNDEFCSSFMEGIYIVYLYTYNKKSVYLTLNQGCTAIKEGIAGTGKEKEQAVINLLKQNAINICQSLEIPQGFSSCKQESIDLASDSSYAKNYEAGTVLFKKYDVSSMPDDEQLAKDLRQLLLVYQKLNKENKKNKNQGSSENKERSYWLLNHGWQDITEQDRIKLISYALQNNCCIMNYEPKLAEDAEDSNWKRNITQVVHSAPEIKEGDVIILRGGDYIYAYGYAVKHKKIDRTITLNDFHKEGKDSRDPEIWGKTIGFFDAPIFYCDYKNLYNQDGYWAQRIDIDRWYGICPGGIWKDTSINDPSRRYIPMNQISEEDGKKLIKLLGGNMEDYKEILLKVHNIVLTGAPGTGKTFLANEIAHLVTDDDSRICKVQFHPSYDYTDFVEGLRPFQPKDGPIGFKRKDGIFKLLCKKAKNDPDNKYVLIIDEINRGDISKIFGELFSLIEHDYRGKEDAAIETQYSNLIDPSHLDPEEWDSKKFYVPENVYIIGTMNDIDRSVESMDFAIRRRFTWLELTASESLSMLNAKIKDATLREECIARMNAMNNVIANTPGLGSAYEIGGAYFAHITEFDGSEAFDKLWKYYLSPIVKEYLRGFPDTSKYEAIKDAFDNPQTQEAGQ